MLAISGVLTGTAEANTVTYAYVANSGSGTVTPVNLSTMKAGADISLGGKSYAPTSIAIAPDGSYAYVANSGNDSVSVIAMNTNTALATIQLPIGSIPISLAVTPNGKKVYVANSGNNTVSVISVNSLSPGADTVSKEIELPENASPISIAITPNGEIAYVVDNGIDAVTPIEITNGDELGPTFYGVGGNPWAIAISSDGTTGYVSSSTAGDVVPFSIPADGIKKQISVGQTPTLISISASTDFMYVANKGSKNISAVNLANNAKTQIGLPGSYPATGLATWTNSSNQTYVLAAITGSGGSGVLDPINAATGASGTEISVGNNPAAVAIGTSWKATSTTPYNLSTVGSASITSSDGTTHHRHRRRHYRLRSHGKRVGNYRVKLTPSVRHGRVRRKHHHLCVPPKAKLIFKLSAHRVRRHHRAGRNLRVRERGEALLLHHQRHAERLARKRHGRIAVRIKHLKRGKYTVVAALVFTGHLTEHLRRHGRLVRIRHRVHLRRRIKLGFHVC